MPDTELPRRFALVQDTECSGIHTLNNYVYCWTDAVAVVEKFLEVCNKDEYEIRLDKRYIITEACKEYGSFEIGYEDTLTGEIINDTNGSSEVAFTIQLIAIPELPYIKRSEELRWSHICSGPEDIKIPT